MALADLNSWIWPVIWVAVAVGLAVAAAWLAIRMHARAAAESDWPDLVIRELLLTGEVRIGPDVFHNCRLIGVANRGRGPAINLRISLGVDDGPMNAGHALSDSLAPGRGIAASTASFAAGPARPRVYQIDLACHDARGRRHVTRFAYHHPPTGPGDGPAADSPAAAPAARRPTRTVV